MQIKFITLLFRVFFITKKNRLLFFVTMFVTMTILIATMVCTLTIAIQNSVHNLLQKQLRASFQDAIVTPKANFFCKKQIFYLNASSMIAAWAPASWRYVLVAGRQQAELQVSMIKFIDPKKEKAFFLQHMESSDCVESNYLSRGVIIGKGLQENLGVSVGDRINVTFMKEKRQRKKIIFKPAHYSLEVTGIIETKISEIDAMLILCSYDFGKTFMPNLYWDEIAIRCKKNDIFLHDVEIAAMQKKFPELRIRSLKELHPTFFSSMILEQYVTRLYLIFLLFFVFITLTALFFMQTIYNQKKVIILNFLGMSVKKIYFFTFFAIIVQTFLASLIGICLARFVGYMITSYTPREIQVVYSIANLPIEFSWQLIVTMLMSMILIATIVGSFTFLLLSRYNTLQTLKNETS